MVSPLSGAREFRKVIAEGDDGGIGEADGGLMLPAALRSAPVKASILNHGHKPNASSAVEEKEEEED